MIQAGDKIPSVPVKHIVDGEVRDATSDAVLGTGKVVFFAVPGAFTPTCSANHLPGYLEGRDALLGKGVDRIVCAAVNDAFVVKAWAEQSGAKGRIEFIADGNGALAKALGLDKDFSGSNMGTRFARSAMIVTNGVVDSVFVETAAGVDVSGAPAVLAALEGGAR